MSPVSRCFPLFFSGSSAKPAAAENIRIDPKSAKYQERRRLPPELLRRTEAFFVEREREARQRGLSRSHLLARPALWQFPWQPLTEGLILKLGGTDGGGGGGGG